MKNLYHMSVCGMALLAASACSLVNNPHSEPPPASAQVQATRPLEGQYAMSGDCRAQAENRLALINKPSTYPLSEQEKNNALIALYSECSHERQIASAGPQGDASQFASLSPAAGGPARAAYPYPYPAAALPANAGIVVVNGNGASQFAALSPAAGGLPAEAYAAVPPGAYANAFGAGAAAPPVVVVQSPAAAMVPPVVARPVVATPVAPTAMASAPAMQPSMPAGRQPSSLGPQSAASGSLPQVASAAPAKKPQATPAAAGEPLNGKDPQQLEDVLLKN